ncbi:ADP-ribose pyrophosphatase YjhB [Fructobacillus cardui]|uniref:NUDIX hydrolase n=1 Tax=Fructobacillus cardui TaxID=2893170 RepID=UPI002DA39E19|nr:ADP-ribose pyrophosphatase YjhB [Fructobacillus cardui]
MEHYHRAFGVYGILYEEHHGLVVIKKNAGPYLNRYDLPGGSLESGEPLEHALAREVKEETDLTVEKTRQIGTTSFIYPWQYLNFNMNQHIAVFYEVERVSGGLTETPLQFLGQDSLGSLFVPLDLLTEQNSSPLVLKAKEYLLHNKHFDTADCRFSQWKVLTKPVF